LADCVVGIDLGTSGCKVLALSEDLEVIAEAYAKYDTVIPRPGWAEQNPAEWWSAVLSTLREISKKLEEKRIRVSGIGLTGQMHSLVLVNRNGKVLRPAILWNDQRNSRQCEEILERVGGLERLVKLINNGIFTGVTLGKILWVMENEPEIFSRTHKILVPKDYIRYMLSGDFATDVSDASGTHLFDIRRKMWCRELLELFDIPEEILPDKVVESREVTGYLKEELCERLGWPDGVPIVGGGADVIVQSTCSGGISSNELVIILGTAGIVAITSEEIIDNSDGVLQFYCSTLPNKWALYGCTLAAGASLEWAKTTFCDLEETVAKRLGISVYDVISEEASKSDIGSGGIFYLPFLSGERAPHPDPNARGVFIGLNLKTNKEDILRSVLEGVSYSLRAVADKIMEVSKLKVKEVYLTGGGTMSPLWRQIFADVFGRPVKVLKYSEKGGAFGAAVLAGVGVGMWRNVEEVVRSLEIVHENQPIEGNKILYEKHYKVYLQLYPSLKNLFKIVASLQQEVS